MDSQSNCATPDDTNLPSSVYSSNVFGFVTWSEELQTVARMLASEKQDDDGGLSTGPLIHADGSIEGARQDSGEWSPSRSPLESDSAAWNGGLQAIEDFDWDKRVEEEPVRAFARPDNYNAPTLPLPKPDDAAACVVDGLDTSARILSVGGESDLVNGKSRIATAGTPQLENIMVEDTANSEEAPRTPLQVDSGEDSDCPSPDLVNASALQERMSTDPLPFAEYTQATDDFWHAQLEEAAAEDSMDIDEVSASIPLQEATTCKRSKPGKTENDLSESEEGPVKKKTRGSTTQGLVQASETKANPSLDGIGVHGEEDGVSTTTPKPNLGTVATPRARYQVSARELYSLSNSAPRVHKKTFKKPKKHVVLDEKSDIEDENLSEVGEEEEEDSSEEEVTSEEEETSEDGEGSNEYDEFGREDDISQSFKGKSKRLMTKAKGKNFQLSKTAAGGSKKRAAKGKTAASTAKTTSGTSKRTTRSTAAESSEQDQDKPPAKFNKYGFRINPRIALGGGSDAATTSKVASKARPKRSSTKRKMGMQSATSDDSGDEGGESGTSEDAKAEKGKDEEVHKKRDGGDKPTQRRTRATEAKEKKEEGEKLQKADKGRRVTRRG